MQFDGSDGSTVSGFYDNMLRSSAEASSRKLPPVKLSVEDNNKNRNYSTHISL